jgi:hypothetical protein
MALYKTSRVASIVVLAETLSMSFETPGRDSLERNQAGPGGGKVSTNGNTLVVLTQPANVPSLNGKA